MIITWMAYAILFTALVAAGALALDRVVAIWGGPRRFVWLAALTLSALVPVALVFRPASRPVPSVAIEAPTTALDAPRTVLGATIALPRAGAAWRMPASWNRYAAGAWAGASSIFFIVLLNGFVIIRRRRAAWRRAEVDGHDVLVADDAGPAVVGALHPRIVLPAWVLELDHSERQLMLHHEVEHIRAGDPRLLLLAALSVVLFPWNAALWFVAQRLRLAIEIDCDARVLRVAGRPREYGMLLLAVGARHGVSLPLATSLAERRPLLERRIVAMTMLRPSRPVLASIPFAMLAVIAASAIAQTPLPPRPAPAAAPVAPSAVGVPIAPEPVASLAIAPQPPAPAGVPRTAPVAAATRVAPPTPSAAPVSQCCEISLETLAVWMVAHHMNVVRGDTSVAEVVFVVDADGKYLTSMSRSNLDVRLNPMNIEPNPTEAGLNGGGRGGRGGRVGGPGTEGRARVGGPGTGQVPDSARAPNEVHRQTTMELGSPGTQTTQFRGHVSGPGGQPVSINIGGVAVSSEAVDGMQTMSLAGGRLSPYRIRVTTIFLKRD